jgi:hypothetical protein
MDWLFTFVPPATFVTTSRNIFKTNPGDPSEPHIQFSPKPYPASLSA